MYNVREAVCQYCVKLRSDIKGTARDLRAIKIKTCFNPPTTQGALAPGVSIRSRRQPMQKG